LVIVRAANHSWRQRRLGSDLQWSTCYLYCKLLGCLLSGRRTGVNHQYSEGVIGDNSGRTRDSTSRTVEGKSWWQRPESYRPEQRANPINCRKCLRVGRIGNRIRQAGSSDGEYCRRGLIASDPSSSSYAT